VTSQDEDLWFGLRGGLNSFGVVTKFILNSHPQSEIWAGVIVYAGDQLDAIKEAYVEFQQVNDTKAAILINLGYGSGQFTTTLIVFYDAPTPPPGLFDGFLAIPAIENTVSTSSFSDLILSFDSPLSIGGLQSMYYSGVPVKQYSPAIIDAFKNQTIYWGTKLEALDNNASVVTTLEQFSSTLFSYGSDSAYPPDRSQVFLPSNINYAWSNASLDATMADMLRQHTEQARAAVIADGQNISQAAVYVNYALFSTPLEDIYGANLPRLRAIRAEIDPEDVMGLAGGFKF